jgi:DNA-directed RNA polymerase specialized sigma24 family protein
MTEPDFAQRQVDDLDEHLEAFMLELRVPFFRFASHWCGNIRDAEEIAKRTFVTA